MARPASTTRGPTPAGSAVTERKVPPRGERVERIKPKASNQAVDAMLDVAAIHASLATSVTAQAWSMILAQQLGLMEGVTRHINARVPARLLERATERAGTEAVTEVVTQALASLATRSELGPWLAEHWGELRDVAPDMAAELESL